MSKICVKRKRKRTTFFSVYVSLLLIYTLQIIVCDFIKIFFKYSFPVIIVQRENIYNWTCMLMSLSDMGCLPGKIFFLVITLSLVIDSTIQHSYTTIYIYLSLWSPPRLTHKHSLCLNYLFHSFLSLLLYNCYFHSKWPVFR